MFVFRVSQFEARTLIGVATPRDPAVTEYVRMRMKALRAAHPDMTGKAFAAKIGISQAFMSTLDKAGVGPRSIAGFARVLGFRDADELRRAAYDWYREQEPRAAKRLEEAAVQSALEIQKLNHPTVPEEQWTAILARFDHPDFAGRSSEYWLLALGQEVGQDMLRAVAAKQGYEDEKRLERWRERKADESMKSKFREASRTKKQLKQVEAETAEREAAESTKATPLLAERRR
jgi:hypothetical protein